MGEVVSQALRVMPTAKYPSSYAEACRKLVGMKIRERISCCSSGDFNDNHHPWSTATVTGYNESIGAHMLKYDSDTEVLVKLCLRDVVLIERVSPEMKQPSLGASEEVDIDGGGAAALPLFDSDSACTITNITAGSDKGSFVVSGADHIAGGRANGTYIRTSLDNYSGVAPYAKRHDSSMVMLRWEGSKWMVCDIGMAKNKFPGDGGVVYYSTESSDDKPPVGNNWRIVLDNVWEFETKVNGSNQWLLFRPLVVTQLNEASKKNNVSSSVQITALGGAEYTVDLSRMLQISFNKTTGVEEKQRIRLRHRGDATSDFIPKCPAKGHAMTMSNGVGYYSEFNCNDCEKAANGERWFCHQCSEDYCFACKPRAPGSTGAPTASHAGLFFAAAAASASPSSSASTNGSTSYVGKRMQIKRSVNTKCGSSTIANMMVTVVNAYNGKIDIVLDDGRCVFE
jgi:hypothetical protein